MKRTFKTFLLLTNIFLLFAFPAVDMQAQSINSGFEGTWVLDSVQVKEVMPDSIVEKTVLPGDDSKFNFIWFSQMTLDAKGVFFYKENGGRNIIKASYKVEDENGNKATLTINMSPGYRELKVQLLSEKTLLATQTFSSEYDMKNIDIVWNIYYHKE